MEKIPSHFKIRCNLENATEAQKRRKKQFVKCILLASFILEVYIHNACKFFMEKNNCYLKIICYRSSLVAQWVKDLALPLQQLGSLLWHMFLYWPGNFHMLQVQSKKKKKIAWNIKHRQLFKLHAVR